MLVSIFVFSLFAVTQTADADSPPIQSPIDRKDYRLLELENGLKVLLVSDPQIDKASASLDVHVGSGSDLDGWQGIAHFLEHMLFLGTEKYPEADEYKRFIEDHGGQNNAYTSFDHTNYYFDVDVDELFPALDRFAQFFISPIFNEVFVDRERAVVHSEYQARLKDEGRRLWAGGKRLINPAHPGSHFSVGSDHTLRDRTGATARQKLIEFYQRYYSANLMTLAVVGAQSLDQLEEWVIPLFVEIPNRKADVPLFMTPYFNPDLIPSRLNLIPKKDTLRADFLFPIDSTQAHYRTKPLGYVANLIGHEGEGSLLALLEELGWAEGLSAGIGYMDKLQGVFQVSIQLTEQGVSQVNEIGALLFQYIELIKNSGVSEWRYQEERKLAKIAFRFAEEQNAGTLARSLAARLHQYPGIDVLQGPYMMEEYHSALITDLLDLLRADNVILQVVAKGMHVDNQTPFYAVEYGIQTLSPATIDRWKQGGHDARLMLPLPNPFIPNRLTPQLFDNVSVLPERLIDEPGMQAWYHGDSQFGTPRAAFYFSIESPAAVGNVRNLVLTELFVRRLRQHLKKTTYPARLAGLNYRLYRHSRGFSVQINGYEDGQLALLQTVLENLFNPTFDEEKLALTKAELIRQWNNVFLEVPSQQTVHEIYRLLIHPYWNEQQRLAMLDSIDLQELTTHAARLLQKIHITALSHGDITEERARKMTETLAAAFANSDRVDSIAPPVVGILTGNRASLRSIRPDHDDSAVAMYFQGRTKTDMERVKMLLLAQLMEAPFFFDMRTTHHVGYLVYATHLGVLNVPGLLFSVQSPSHSPFEINQLVDEFLGKFEQLIEAMEARNFAQIKQGLRSRILLREQKLTDRTQRYWQEINWENDDFDTRERMAELLKQIGKQDIQAYFNLITKQRPRKLVVQSIGRRKQITEKSIDRTTFEEIDSVNQFRESTQRFFPEY